MGETIEAEWTYEDVRAWEIEQRREMLKKCGHPEGESRVYCIINCVRSAVKIGTTKNVRKRLQQLQTASPDELYLHEHIRGGRAKERELHQRYAKLRKIGEWFYDPECDIAGHFGLLSAEDMIEDLERRQRGLV